ncbi:MAG: polyisoprenoid-binding protein [candidate division Zixibacteria bacterium]|nr:polyisoprenoid-binding protein [candidate division Zixibacteria bacterium]
MKRNVKPRVGLTRCNFDINSSTYKGDIMRIRNLLFTAFAVFFIANLAFAVPIYKVDPVHSDVGFKVSHLVISKVRGNFTEFEGEIGFDKNNLGDSYIKGIIQVKSINTNNEDRDSHLRSNDFFAADDYPQIKFESEEIMQRGGDYVALGDLTMRGVTREVEVPFTVSGPIEHPNGKKVIALSGGLKVDRQDYGIAFNKTLDSGGLVVGNEVEIELEIEAIEQ